MEINEFSYGGIESSTFGITYDAEKLFIIPQKRKYTQEIIGYDGVVDFELKGYEELVITLPLYFDGNYADLRTNQEKIAAWLYSDGTAKQLVFGNKPDRYYMAKVYAAVSFNIVKDRYIGDIQFECNPPWPYLTDGTQLTPEQILWLNCETDTNQFVKEFTANGSLRFVNPGLPTKPIVKVIGNIRSGLTLSCGEQCLKFNTDILYDGFAVDCNNETVLQLSDGENLYEFVDSDCDPFFEFPSGNVELQVAMPKLGTHPHSITVIVEVEIAKRG